MKFLGALAFVGLAAAWNYTENGDDWDAADFPECHLRSLQSPIDIVRKSKSKYTYRRDKDLPSFDHTDFPAISNVSVTNTGTGIEITNFPDFKLQANDFIHYDYTLASANIHWGGSEHKINGKRYDGEVQFFFEKDGSAPANIGSDFVVLAVLLTKGSKDKKAYFDIIDKLVDVESVGTSVDAELNLEKAFPNKFHKEFYMYEGLTSSPPCDKTVTYFVARHKKSVSKGQMKKFEEATSIKNNYRHIQSKGTRVVVNSFSASGSGESEGNSFADMMGGSQSDIFSSMFG